MRTHKYELQLTGYAEIDQQHEQLVKWLEKIENAQHHGFGDKVVREMLRNLKLYIVLHFETEERLLRQIDYVGIESHIKEHQALNLKVQQLERDFEEHKESAGMDLSNLLRNWLITHINVSDSDFAK